MGRMFVCGDIHGAYGALMGALDKVGFDFEQDHLYALGDLVDRGPDNMEVLRLLNEPWFSSIKGNHEQMMEMAHTSWQNERFHHQNGGAWFTHASEEERAEAVALVKDLPCAMEVTTPSGRRIGLVHGDLPTDDWNDYVLNVSSMDDTLREQSIYATLWGRKLIKRAQREPENVLPIKNIDMVYMGHTPTAAPVQAANMRWIDTGACFSDGYLTVEELV